MNLLFALILQLKLEAIDTCMYTYLKNVSIAPIFRWGIRANTNLIPKMYQLPPSLDGG
jgi:hypothetical protein